MQTLIVTGGAGFIGSNFVRYMLGKYPEYRIIVLDALTYAGNRANLADVWRNPNFTFIQGDINDAALVDNLAQNADAIVNFAAESHNDRAIVDPQAAVRANFNGVFVLLEAARRHKHERFHQVSCYDEQTRALTRDGLKHYRDIAPGDRVLSLNPDTGLIEEKEVEKIIVQDYEGAMVRFQSSRISLRVTPNHRMLFTTPSQPGRIRIESAEELSRRAVADVPRGSWRGVQADTIEVAGVGRVHAASLFYLAGMFIGDGFLATQTSLRPNKTGLPRAEYLKRCRGANGRFLNPGRIGDRETTATTCHRIFFDVPEGDKGRARLEATLDRLGIPWSAHRGKAGEHIYFSSRPWTEFFAQFGSGATNKHIPSWMLAHEVPLLRALFDGLIDSDGHYRPGGNLPSFSTSSERLVAGVVELGFKLGWLPRFTQRSPEACTTLAGTGRVTRPTLPAYQVFFRREDVGIGRAAASAEHYSGKIWCLRVRDNKNFIVERGGTLLFCGNTDETYGTTDGIFREGDPLEPNQPYSAAKAGGELMVRAYHQTFGLPTIVTRGSNTFGPYHYPEKIIPLFITNLLDDVPVPVYGDGMQVRDWMYVLDHCKGVDIALHHGTPGEVYNVGGENDRPNLEIVHLLLRFLGKPESLIRHVQDRPGHDRRYSLDCSKMAGLGYRPETERFEERLRETVEWYKANEPWWRAIKEKQHEYQQFMRQWYAERQ
jgi:dTDP-D-glucose 4,6-dehydratase